MLLADAVLSQRRNVLKIRALKFYVSTSRRQMYFFKMKDFLHLMLHKKTELVKEI
jgi:hypothetical protein